MFLSKLKAILVSIIVSLLILILGILTFDIRSLWPNKILNKTEYLAQEIVDFEIVIARYNEDLSWLENEFTTEKIIIYNKGEDDITLPSHLNYKIIKLPNIGRESHTYLYHIISNYANLAARTLFLQGDPYDPEVTRFMYFPLKKYKIMAHNKCHSIIAANCILDVIFLISKPIKNFNNVYKNRYLDTIFSNTSFAEYISDFGLKRNFFDIFIYLTYGGNFAIDRNNVLLNSKGYYEKIIKTLENKSPVEGHYLERLWDRIFMGASYEK